MAERGKQRAVSCSEAGSMSEGVGCCQVDAIITIDNRGQLVLPKEVRDKAGMSAGDKFAVISCESGGKVCCISLVRAEDFAEKIKGMLGPMMKGILQ